MYRFILTTVAVGSMTMLLGCKDVCEKASDVLVDDCGFDEGDDDDDDDEEECEGDAEAYAQCIVDNPDATCEYFEDIMNASEDNAFVECIADI